MKPELDLYTGHTFTATCAVNFDGTIEALTKIGRRQSAVLPLESSHCSFKDSSLMILTNIVNGEGDNFGAIKKLNNLS